MDEIFPWQGELPTAAEPALHIVRRLSAAGHQALLAGGCVRDLLLGRAPQDYDVATDAPPDQVCKLFPATRKVGAQFGVVLVRQHRRWVEVATFRTDGPYLDGRRPASVTLTDARHDAQRRDFTVNGLFLDPLAGHVIDYVGGKADLAAGCIRAIGQPAARFEEDHLRLLRAVRFAARLGFPIEPATLEAIRRHAPRLAGVAPERVREELSRMLAHASRLRAWEWLEACGLLAYLWPGAGWDDAQKVRIRTMLGRLGPAAAFEVALAVMLGHCPDDEIQRIARAITLANDERETTTWLVGNQAALDNPDAPTLAQLKRLMAGPAFDGLKMLALARYQDWPDAAARDAHLAARLAAIDPAAVQPPPLVTGDDLLARGLPPGPRYKQILEALYTQQLDERLGSRKEALAALDAILAAPL